MNHFQKNVESLDPRFRGDDEHSAFRTWTVVDSGRASGFVHMETDRAALARVMDGASVPPTLRFFQWDKPTITYGYLLDLESVRAWASSMDHRPWTMDFAQRPTGGGAVRHDTSDLSFSLLWRRSERVFSESPRACYAKIHTLIQKALQPFFKGPLRLRHAEMTRILPSKHFSVCFDQPVCNDVMLGECKILGGALRITRQAILYQGAMQLNINVDMANIKRNISEAFLAHPLQTALA